MTACRCLTPPFDFRDYDIRALGVDPTHGRFAEVTVLTCQACGSLWLQYFVEYEQFPRSGRWYRGLVTPEQLVNLTPEQAPGLLAGCPWYFYGGSYFESGGRKGSGPLQVDLTGPPIQASRAMNEPNRRFH
jgi:hypothetical protein